MIDHLLLLTVATLGQVESIDPNLTPPRAVLEPDVGPQVAALLRARRERGAVGLESVARLHRADVDGQGRIEVVLAPVFPGAIDVGVLRWLGARVLDSRQDRAIVRADLDLVAMLPAIVPGVAAAFMSPPLVTCVATQGVVKTGADQAHGNGATGLGMRLAIVDAGFAGLANLIASGALPEPWKQKNYTSSGLEKSSAHGTAVAEIAHQMAPDAALLLIKIANLSHFEKALKYAADKGADVVNASLGFPTANFGDGTGDAADAVKKARQQGVLTVVSAGNYGDGHWLGAWTDADADDFLDFSPGDEGLTFEVPAGDDVSVYLVWDDFPFSKIDIDLAVYYLGTDTNPLPPGPNTLMDFSTSIQNGFLPPAESVAFVAPSSGNYAAFVNRVKKTPGNVALFVSHTVKDGNNVAASSVITPADSKKAVAVGAVAQFLWGTGPVEQFSSRGPNTKGHPKPDILGPDRTTSAVGVYDPFVGTSAAAPHVAGAACVLKSELPNLSVGELEQRLFDYAVDVAGTQNEVGHGKVDLHADFFAPVPDPPLVDGAASSSADTSVTIVVSAPSDATPPLRYLFDCVGGKKQGGSDRGWDVSASFVDDGLVPDAVYSYRVKVADSALPSNKTGVSAKFKIRTLAQTPPAPKLKQAGSTWVRLKLRAGANPDSVEYALFNVTAATYVKPSGKAAGPSPVFGPLSKWKSVQVKGLAPGQSYQFRALARNSAGTETVLSDPLDVSTAP